MDAVTMFTMMIGIDASHVALLWSWREDAEMKDIILAWQRSGDTSKGKRVCKAITLNQKFSNNATDSPRQTTSGPTTLSKSRPLRSRISLDRVTYIHHPHTLAKIAKPMYTIANVRAMLLSLPAALNRPSDSEASNTVMCCHLIKVR